MSEKLNKDDLLQQSTDIQNADSTDIQNKKEADEKEYKKRRRMAHYKEGIMCLLAVVIIILAAIAWFSLKSGTETKGMKVTTGDRLFDLQTSGTTSAYAYLLANENLGYSSGTEISSGTYSTGASTGKLALMLTSEDDPMNLGLQPGMDGSFSFTIVPDSLLADDTEHQLKVNYTISLKGYYLSAEKKEAVMVYDEIISSGETPTPEQEAAAQITFDDLNPIDGLTPGVDDNDNYLAARDLLNGHILFFDTYANSKYSGMIDFTTPKEELIDLDSSKTVTINWVWPETFGNIVDENDTVIASEDLEDIIDDIVDNENYFFYSLNKSKITGLDNGNLTEEAVLDDENYLPFSYGYNNADQHIGENIQFLLIEIVADGEIVDK